MGALSRFSDSLEEMEPSRPHPGGHREASRATGRPFPWFEECALSADPLGFQGNSTFPPGREHHPALHISQGNVCVCEHSALQPIPPRPPFHPHPSCWNVLISFSFYSLLCACPGQDCKLRCCLKGRTQTLPSTPSTWTPGTFPVGPMGKDQREEWYLLFAWTSVSKIPLKVLMGRDLSRKSLEDLHISYQKRELPPFLPRGILSEEDERKNWANSPTPPVKTPTSPSWPFPLL